MSKLEYLILVILIAGGILAVLCRRTSLFLLISALVTIVSYGLDKYDAVHKKRRFSEKFLLLLAFFGGAIPALLAMFLFHHKIRKASFFLPVIGMTVLQILLIGMYL